jgi:hypothetical protein
MNTLYMDLKVNGSIEVGGVVITLEQKSGQRAKLRIEHEGVDIRRVPDRRNEPRNDMPGRRVEDKLE